MAGVSMVRVEPVVGIDLVELPADEGEGANARVLHRLQAFVASGETISAEDLPVRLCELQRGDAEILQSILAASGARVRITLSRAAQLGIAAFGMVLAIGCSVLLPDWSFFMACVGATLGLGVMVVAAARGGPGLPAKLVLHPDADLAADPAPRFEYLAGTMSEGPVEDLRSFARAIRQRQGSAWARERAVLYDPVIEKLLELRMRCDEELLALEDLGRVLEDVSSRCSVEQARERVRSESGRLRELRDRTDVVLRRAIRAAVTPEPLTGDTTD